MRAGTLRRRLILQQAQEGRDGTGGVTHDWRDLATLWASVEPLEGRELFEAQQLKAEVSLRVRLRYRSDLGPKQRLVDGSRIYLIEAVLPAAKRDQVELLCREEP